MHARDRRTHTEPHGKSFASAHGGADIGSHTQPHTGADDEPHGKSFASAHAGADTGSHVEPHGEPNAKSDCIAHIIAYTEPHAGKELVLARFQLCQRQLL